MDARRQTDHRTTTAECKVVEPRAARRGRHSRVRNPDVPLQEDGQPSTLKKPCARTERQSKQHRVLRSLRNVNEALHRTQHHAVTHGVSDTFGKPEQLFVRDVVIPRFERGDCLSLEAPAPLRKWISSNGLGESRRGRCNENDRGVKYR